MDSDSIVINHQGSDNINMLAEFLYLSGLLGSDGLQLIPDCVTCIWVGLEAHLLLTFVLPLRCCLPIFMLTVCAQIQQVWNIKTYHYLTN